MADTHADAPAGDEATLSVALTEPLAPTQRRIDVVESAFKRLLSHTRTLTHTHAERILIWEALLGCPSDAAGEAALTKEIFDVNFDLPNQRVVKVDAERTRQDLDIFRTRTHTHMIACILTHYVKAGFRLETPAGDSPTPALRYKQGLNEVLAVFMQLPPPRGVPELSAGRIERLFARFVSRFAPRIYASNDDEFTSLQCTFRLFRLLMLYIDPQLCAALDAHGLPPELYATPWFLTLLGRSNPTPYVFVLWDFLLACARQPGPAIFHFVALALLASQREAILTAISSAAGAAELPLVVSRIGFNSIEHVHQVCATALDFWVETPLSFRRLLHNVSYSGGFRRKGGTEPLPISTSLLSRLESRVAVKISVDELLVGAASRFGSPSSATARGGAASSEASQPPPGTGFGLARLTDQASLHAPPRYVLLDCRSREEYQYGGRLPTAFHLDPELLHDPERLDELISGFQGLRGMHLALMGPGDVSQWYHAPVPPAREEVAPTAAATSVGDASGAAAIGTSRIAPVSDAELQEGELYNCGAAVQTQELGATAATADDEEYVAVRSGLDPLSANEEDDYAQNDATRAFIYLFLQKGFPRVSEVEGGFTALHQHQAHFLDALLVGHDPALCMVCSGGKAAEKYAQLAAADTADEELARDGRSSGPFLRAPAVATKLAARVRDAVASPKVTNLAAGLRGSVHHRRRESQPGSDAPTYAAEGGVDATPSAARKRRYDALRSWLAGGETGRRARAGTSQSSTAVAANVDDNSDEVEIVLFDPAAAPQSTGVSTARSLPPRSRTASVSASIPTPLSASSDGHLAKPSTVRGDAVAHSTAATAVALASSREREPSSATARSKHAGASDAVIDGRVLREVNHVRPYPDLDDRGLIADYDADGMPILSESAWLDSQCDEMEREWHVRASGQRARKPPRSRATASRSRRATAEQPLASTQAAPPAVVNVDEVLGEVAVAAAKQAASAAKSLFRTVLSPPERSAPSHAPGADGRGAATTMSTVDIDGSAVHSHHTSMEDFLGTATKVDEPVLDALVSRDDGRLPPMPPVKQRALPTSAASVSKITTRTSQYMDSASRKAAGAAAKASSATGRSV